MNPIAPVMYNVTRAQMLARIQCRPNEFDLLLCEELRLWEYVELMGGVTRCCQIYGATYDLPPYDIMPANGRQFQPIGAITLPTTLDTDISVLSMKVPVGWDGILTKVLLQFTGSFTQGTGDDLIFRVKIGRRFERNLGNMFTTYGSLDGGPLVIPGVGIRLVSGQTVAAYVNVPTGTGAAPATAQVIAGFSGWFYPRK